MLHVAVVVARVEAIHHPIEQPVLSNTSTYFYTNPKWTES